MELMFPCDHSTWFSLIANNYQCTNGDQQPYHTVIICNVRTKRFRWVQYNAPVEEMKIYVPKVLIDGRMLRQAELLAGLGLPNREVAEMLRNQEELFIHPVRSSCSLLSLSPEK